MGTIRRSPGERVRGWLYTGPLGHLWSAVADLVVLFAAAVARSTKHGMTAGARRLLARLVHGRHRHSRE